MQEAPTLTLNQETIHYSKPVNITLTKCSQAIGKALAKVIGKHWSE